MQGGIMAKVNLGDLHKEEKKHILKSPEQKISEPKKKETSKKLGRPHKDAAERLDMKITVNFSKSEYEKLKEKSAGSFNVPLPQLVRGLLKNSGEI